MTPILLLWIGATLTVMGYGAATAFMSLYMSRPIRSAELLCFYLMVVVGGIGVMGLIAGFVWWLTTFS